MVDPQFDITPYVAEQERTKTRIRYVIDTHVHADHVSGVRKLAEATGAAAGLYADAGARYEFLGVRDGDVLDLGNVIVRIMHTPGHTPEHICLLVTDKTRGAEPWFVLTGHTLMVGDLGRTELASDAREGARALFQSARRFASLPDCVEVYPGAFSGSVCGRNLNGKPASTIGFERVHNRGLVIGSEKSSCGSCCKISRRHRPGLQRSA